MSKLRVVTFAILLLVVAVGCSSSDQAAIDKAVSATLIAAQPATAAATAISTPESVPADTPVPEPTAAPVPTPTLEPTAVPTPTPAATPTTVPSPGIGSSEWWEFVAPFSEFSRKSGDPEEATDIDLKKIYAAVFVADSWVAGSAPRDQNFRQFVESTSFGSLKSLAVDVNELMDEVDVFTPWAQPYLEPVSEQESTLTFYLLFGWCLGQQSELITNEWNGCIDFVSGIWELGDFADLDNVSLQKIAVTPTPTPEPTATPTPSPTPPPIPTATPATDAAEPKLLWEVKTCTTASIEERGECEPLDMIERWNQSVVILVTAPEPIEVTDYYIMTNPPPDLSDPYETPESTEQRIENAVQSQQILVQLSATEFYRKHSSLSASGIYGFFVVDQDYVDGKRDVQWSLDYKSILVSDGDFDAVYASYECSPDRLTLIENLEQYKGKLFSMTLTIASVQRGKDYGWGNLDLYIGTLNGDSTQPIEISARPYQHRRWYVNDQVRFFGALVRTYDAVGSYMHPTPAFVGRGSALATASECVAG